MCRAEQRDSISRILGRELRATKDEGQSESSILRGLIRDLEADLAEDKKELQANDDAISAKLMQAEQNLQAMNCDPYLAMRKNTEDFDWMGLRELTARGKKGNQLKKQAPYFNELLFRRTSTTSPAASSTTPSST